MNNCALTEKPLIHNRQKDCTFTFENKRQVIVMRGIDTLTEQEDIQRKVIDIEEGNPSLYFNLISTFLLYNNVFKFESSSTFL